MFAKHITTCLPVYLFFPLASPRVTQEQQTEAFHQGF